MCNPVAIIGGISLAASIGGGIVSAKGAADKAESDQNYYNHLADVAEENIGEVQKTAEYDRNAITQSSSREAQTNKVQTQQLMGTQATVVAANKIGGSSVTAMDISRDTINKSTLDEMYIRFNADTQKYMTTKKEKSDIKNLREQARGYRAGGDAARAAGNLAVAGIALSTVGQVADTVNKYYGKDIQAAWDKAQAEKEAEKEEKQDNKKGNKKGK